MKRIFILLLAVLMILPGCSDPFATQEEPISIDVYSADSTGENINRSSKEVLATEDLPLLYITEMVKANYNLFPENTSVNSVLVEENTLTVDFSKEIKSISEEDFLYINELCALAVSQGERSKGDKIAKVNLLCEGEHLKGFFQYPYMTRLVDMAGESNFPIWMLYLYFPNKDNTQLIREYRLIPAGSNNAQELIIEELHHGTEDPDNKNNILPQNATVLNMNYEKETEIFVLNFSEQFISECTPGQENLLVQSMLACYNEFVTVKQVQLQVNGKQDVSLGDFSFASPMTPDWNYFDNPKEYFEKEEE